jgi:hypothetical protein
MIDEFHFYIKSGSVAIHFQLRSRSVSDDWRMVGGFVCMRLVDSSESRHPKYGVPEIEAVHLLALTSGCIEHIQNFLCAQRTDPMRSNRIRLTTAMPLAYARPTRLINIRG